MSRKVQWFETTEALILVALFVAWALVQGI